uniref:Uncharacterized protein n=1 Tax=Anguilla anguilla TaxID=7936 RepID=A0A0E9S4Y7_ANGAN
MASSRGSKSQIKSDCFHSTYP